MLILCRISCVLRYFTTLESRNCQIRPRPHFSMTLHSSLKGKCARVAVCSLSIHIEQCSVATRMYTLCVCICLHDRVEILRHRGNATHSPLLLYMKHDVFILIGCSCKYCAHIMVVKVFDKLINGHIRAQTVYRSQCKRVHILCIVYLWVSPPKIVVIKRTRCLLLTFPECSICPRKMFCVVFHVRIVSIRISTSAPEPGQSK